MNLSVYYSHNLKKVSIHHKNLNLNHALIKTAEKINSPIFFERNKKVLDFKILYSRRNYERNSPDSVRKTPCNNDECENCCIGKFQCGSKLKCENLRVCHKLFSGTFGIISLLFLVFLIFKIAMSPGKPEHRKEDAIDPNTLDTFKDLFLKKAQFRENNKTF